MVPSFTHDNISGPIAPPANTDTQCFYIEVPISYTIADHLPRPLWNCSFYLRLPLKCQTEHQCKPNPKAPYNTHIHPILSRLQNTVGAFHPFPFSSATDSSLPSKNWLPDAISSCSNSKNKKIRSLACVNWLSLSKHTRPPSDNGRAVQDCSWGYLDQIVFRAFLQAEVLRSSFPSSPVNHRVHYSTSVSWHQGWARTWLMSYLASTSRFNMHRTRSMLSSLIVQGTRRSRSMISSML